MEKAFEQVFYSVKLFYDLMDEPRPCFDDAFFSDTVESVTGLRIEE